MIATPPVSFASRSRELFLVVFALGLLHLRANLIDPLLEVFLLARAVDDRAGLLLDLDALGFAELFERDVLQFQTKVFADELAAGENGDVAQHGLTAIAEARGLDRANLEDAAELVDDQGGQGFALDIFRDDEQRLAGAVDLLEQGQHVADIGELLLVNQDEGVLEFTGHVLGRDEVGRDIALVKGHAFDELQRRLGGLAFLDSDDAVLADLGNSLGHDLADGRVVVGADRGDVFDVLASSFSGFFDIAVKLVTTASTALSMPRLIAIGLAPAVMLRSPS